MGIRFQCPNGHRLNVKSHLAGKRGYCPHCNAKVVIPVLPDEQRIPQELLAADFALPAELESDGNGTNHDGLWYVRPPSGGQFGPVDLNQLRRWISEQRVPQDSLLLKEGWPEWQVAAVVMEQGFGQSDLGGPDVVIDIHTNAAGPVVLPATGGSRRIRAALVLMLALLTVGLLAVLVLILNVSR